MSDIAAIDLQCAKSVTFFKRDELTTDLICCEICVSGQTYRYHEEAQAWPDFIAKLEALDGFRTDWFAQVSQPPFKESRFVAFESLPA